MTTDPLSLNQLIENEPLFELFSTKVAQQAAELADQQAARVRNRTTLITSFFLLALAGAGGLAFEVARTSISENSRSVATSVYRENINQTWNEDGFAKAVRQVVEKNIEANRIAIERIRDANTLTNAVAQIRAGDEFTKRQADEVLLGLENLANLEEDPFFNQKSALRDIAIAFAAVDDNQLLARLEEKFIDQMLGEVEILQALVQSSGADIVGVLSDPSKFTGHMKDDWDEKVDRFQVYANALRKNNFPEVPFSYQVILSSIQEEPKSARIAMATELKTRSDQEIRVVAQIFTGLLEGTWIKGGLSDARGAIARDRAISVIDELKETHTVFELLSTLK